MNNWLDNDFDDMLNTSWMPRMNVTAPAINVKENDKAYEVELAAPGTTKDDFKVNVDKDGCLTTQKIAVDFRPHRKGLHILSLNL